MRLGNASLKHGPDLGYFPNAMKFWLITKPGKEVAARILFDGTAINVSTWGHRHLGAALGSREYLEEYVSQKVEDWVAQVVQLAEFAKSQPQADFIFGLRHMWTYFQRTLPDIDELLEPLERAIADSLIPTITNPNCSNEERNLLSLPVRFGGMGITNPKEDAASQYTSSVVSTIHLTERIVAQIHNPQDAEDVRSSISHSRKEKNNQFPPK